MIPSVVIKVGMVGDSQIGKTSLMVKYVEGSFDEDYIQTLGALGFIQSRLPRFVDGACRDDFGFFDIKASISWRRPSQCGGRRSPSRSGTWVASGSSSTCSRWCAMMQSRSCSCLISHASLRSIRSRSGIDKREASTRRVNNFHILVIQLCLVPIANRGVVQTAIPFLVGTKFDTFSTFPRDEQEEITKQVRSFLV